MDAVLVLAVRKERQTSQLRSSRNVDADGNERTSEGQRVAGSRLRPLSTSLHGCAHVWCFLVHCAVLRVASCVLE